MPGSTNTLPNDAESLRAIIAQQAAMIARNKVELEACATKIATLESAEISSRATVRALEALIETLRLRILRLKRQRFGRSSEKIEREIAQLELALEDLGVALSTQQAAANMAPPAPVPSDEDRGSEAKAPRRRGVRVTGPISRRRVVLDPGDTCPDCGGPLREVGEDISKLVELIAARLEVIETARPKKSCRCCEKIVQAPLPSKPIARSQAGPGLLAHILVGKYDDHLPLYRQCEIFARQGFEIPRPTLIDWTGQAIRTLRPLVAALKMHVFSSSRLHTDNTPVPVLDPGSTRNKTREGRLWVYVLDERPHGGANPPAAAYFYSPDRKAIHPQSHLRGFTGILQADAYAGYQQFYQPDPLSGEVRMREAACWAHLRRDIHDFYKSTGSPIAKEALDRIGERYDIERKINGEQPGLRLAVRQQESAPRISALKVWFEEQVALLPPKHDLAKAFLYGLNRWTSFTLFLEDGTVAIDNNAAERAIRPITLGRRNWLFAGSDAGGENAADILSLIETAKLCGVNPESYLADVLARINDHMVNRIGELLPWNWTPLEQCRETA